MRTGLSALAAAVTVALLLPGSLASGAQPASAGTVVTVAGKVVTITVTIDLIGDSDFLGEEPAMTEEERVRRFDFDIPSPEPEPEPPGAAQGRADRLAAAMAAYWNAAFERLSNDCVEYRLVVEINSLPEGTLPDKHELGEGRPRAMYNTPGHHLVVWAVTPGNGFNVSRALPPATFYPYDEDGVAPPGEDDGSPYEHELHANWSPYLENIRDYAHEFGHFLGLGDDYGDGDVPLPGREGTLMDHGDFVDQNLLDRLGELARGAGVGVPACETWEGTWDAGFHVPAPCTPSVWPQVGTLSATVAADGSLSGRGELVNHTGVCGGTDVPQEVPVTPLFTGVRTEDEIRLQIQLPGLGTRTVRMPRRGDVAEGTLTVPLGGASRWEIRARLECTTC